MIDHPDFSKKAMHFAKELSKDRQHDIRQSLVMPALDEGEEVKEVEPNLVPLPEDVVLDVVVPSVLPIDYDVDEGLEF